MTPLLQSSNLYKSETDRFRSSAIGYAKRLAVISARPQFPAVGARAHLRATSRLLRPVKCCVCEVLELPLFIVNSKGKEVGLDPFLFLELTVLLHAVSF